MFRILRHAAPDAESGRGLEIVASLSIDWGWEQVPGMGGKRTWALLATGVSSPRLADAVASLTEEPGTELVT